MKVVVGLGNPGRKYKNNRHNIGYRVVEELAARIKAGFKKSLRLNCHIAQGKIDSEEIICVKPYTFMNNSGFCVDRVLRKYKVSMQDILIVYDDADLPLGEIRLRQKGSCAGHRGLASITYALGSEQIDRLRVGIGKMQSGELADYVLSDFCTEEQEDVKNVIARAVPASIDWITQGAEFVMGKYNRRGGQL